jgi:hypothetical protein
VPLAPATPPCTPGPLTLAWFTDQSGTFSEVSEAAYLLPDGAAGPVLAVAGIIGEACGAEVSWASEWTPEADGGGAPGLFEDGERLVVWPQPGTAPGLLAVTATVGGQGYGPIALIVPRYVCGGYYSGSGGPTVCPVLDPLTWNTGGDSVTLPCSADYLLLATVAGSWPPETAFDWVIDPGATDLQYQPFGAGLAVGPWSRVTPGTFTASVVVTAPGCPDQSLGPVTLILT